MKYEFLEHIADVKFRAYGKSLNEAFENAVLALSSVIMRGKKIKNLRKKEILVKGEDYKSLLYNFIDEIVFLFDSAKFIIGKGEVSLTKKELKAILYGDDAKNYSGFEHVKAATYAEMKIGKAKGQYFVQAVVDV